MRLSGIVLVVIIVLASTIFITLAFAIGAFGQDIFNASDMIDQIRLALDLNFDQEKKIKPFAEEYMSEINQLENQGEENEKNIRSQIIQLNQQFDKKITQILTPDELNIWKRAKKKILMDPGATEEEARETIEAGQE